MADPVKRGKRLLVTWVMACGLVWVPAGFAGAEISKGGPATGVSPASEQPLSVDHRLEIELVPGAHTLIGRDRMRLEPCGRSDLSFHLSGRAKKVRARVNGVDRPFRFHRSELVLSLGPEEGSRPIEIEIRYEAVFDDPVPESPVNTDNPGFGVTATIREEGTFLLAGSGWYPELSNSRATYQVHVKAPKGILAVTAGRSLGHESHDEATLSGWRVDHPVEGLSLSAAGYELHHQGIGAVEISLYLLPKSRDLAPAYLKAAGDFLLFYSGLFGPYPFPKFAVVENFFPTGYGFPSYTLLGSTVLRLPFILTTSLGHEMAHSWWGNGVWVAPDSGNWSEGLTTYVSDYLYKERQSEEAARDYRLQAIRNYTTLVPPGEDLPLSEFAGRTDPVTKAVGYDKGAMVFHMLRRTVGEEPFWGALRDIFREKLFKGCSWRDLQTAFEKRSNRSLEQFFNQWVEWIGAPRVSLKDARLAPEKGGFKVTGEIVQQSPFYDVTVGAFLKGPRTQETREVTLRGRSTPFQMWSPVSPRRLVIDPDYHLLRRLDAAEIPPGVNNLKSSPSTLLVVAANASDRLARTLADSLGLKKFEIVSGRGLDPKALEGKDAILVGYPEDKRLLPELPAGAEISRGSFTVGGRHYESASDAFFGVFPHPRSPGRVLAVFLPIGPAQAETVAAKITHYGRYSFLVFQDGVNTDRGAWETKGSPVVHEWKGTGRKAEGGKRKGKTRKEEVKGCRTEPEAGSR